MAHYKDIEKIERIKVSEAIKDLIKFTEDNSDFDFLLKTDGGNPYKEESKCSIS